MSIRDTKPLVAVAVGTPFAHLQAAGMRAGVTNELLRQRNDTLKVAVHHIL
ncbi:MAG: hypothetical protein AAFO77_15465 [Pseudomonadota bacterium]